MHSTTQPLSRLIARSLALSLALSSFTGCTLLNLDGFQLPEPDPDPFLCAATCAEALNEANGFPESCRPYTCGASGECILAIELDICDGADNDCDGAIDEDTTGYNPAYAEPIDYVGMTIDSMSVASDGNSSTLTWTDDGLNGFNLILPRAGDMAPAVAEINYRTNKEAFPIASAAVGQLDPEGGGNCWTTSIRGSGQTDPDAPDLQPTTCNFLRMAPSRIRDTGFVAAINGAGCSEGQLRIGHTNTENAQDVIVTGPSGRSNSWLGVGLAPGGRCSATQPLSCERLRSARLVAANACGECGGNEKCVDGSCVPATCDADSDCGTGECICAECFSAADRAAIEACGFADVSIAATRPVSNEARGLVAAVSGSARDARCATSNIERDVVLIGAYLDATAGVEFVTTTNEGEPEPIGRTRSSSAPGITAVPGLDESFLVAYPPVDEDGFAVHIVPGLPERVPVLPIACDDESGPAQMCVGDGMMQLPLCLETDCGSDVGACVSGTRVCDGGVGLCDGMVRGRDEICGNTIDDDCDGLVDEDTETLACAEVCVGTDEVCNAVDDDCDGMVDEDTGGEECGESTVGACTMGTTMCRGGVSLCIGEVIPLRNAAARGIERCTTDAVDGDSPYGIGIDDDCDGMVDEGDCPTTCEENDEIERCNGRDDDGDCIIDETPRFNADDFFDAPSTQRPAELVRQCLPVPALGDLPRTVIPGSLSGGQMDDVTLTAISKDGVILVGVTWRESTSPTESRIGFRMLEYEESCRCLEPAGETCEGSCRSRDANFGAFIRATDPIEVTDVPADYTAPSIAYQTDGLLVAGAMRSGSEVSREGGFFVSWATREVQMGQRTGEIFARALTEHDGLPLNMSCTSDCALPLTLTEEGQSPRARFPLLFQADDGVGFVYLDDADTNRQFVTGALTCRPPGDAGE